MSDLTRVLCVDDLPDFIELHRFQIERRCQNVRVSGVQTVQAAIDRIHSQKVDCVIADYQLSGETGLDLYDRIHDEYPDLPFYVFSTHRNLSVGVDGLDTESVYSKNDIPDVYDRLADDIEQTVVGVNEAHI